MATDLFAGENHKSLREFLRRLEENIQQIQQRLAFFEQTYGAATESVFARLQSGELEMSDEYEEWAGEREMLARLMEQKQELEVRLRRAR